MTGALSELMEQGRGILLVQAFEKSNQWPPVRYVRNDRWTDLRDKVYLVKDLLDEEPS